MNNLVRKQILGNKVAKNKILSLKDLEKRKDNILIVRRWGGVGDILNTRMIFKRIKELSPELYITYAIPSRYFDIVKDHPYIDSVIDISRVDITNYGYIVDISSDCGKYEFEHKPNVDKHRSDIWAEISLGIKLTEHNCEISLDDDILNKVKYLFKNKKGPRIGIFPKSASLIKDIPNNVLFDLIKMLNSDGYSPHIIYRKKSQLDFGDNAFEISELSMIMFLHLISLFDYIIAVDSGPFHISSAFKIPTIGIFGWTDHKAVGKYHEKALFVQKTKEELPCIHCWDWTYCEYRKTLPAKCIEMISSQEIYDQFKNLIKLYNYEN